MSTVFEPVLSQGPTQTNSDQSYQPHTPRKITNSLPSMQSSTEPELTTSSGVSNAPTPNRYAHLPTPQSPNNLANYVPGLRNTPDSPMPHASHSAFSARPFAEPLEMKFPEGTPARSPSRSQQIMTPESSPFTVRFNTSIPQNQSHKSTPRTPTASVDMQSMIASHTPTHRTPSPSPSSDPPNSSRLSSPFMAKASVPEAPKHKSLQSSSLTPPLANDPLSSTASTAPSISLISTPPISPHPASSSAASTSTTPPIPAGGEIDRIHHAMQQEHQALEDRRPEYLKRAKRPLSEADPSALLEDDTNRDRFSSVGIMESPMKGRRIKLFQETSEESFEESLMAGGYGRYRTAEWVRQPQPVVVPATAAGAPANIIARLEEAEQPPPPPPSVKELKKQKRLNAFRSTTGPAVGSSKLYPVEVEGKGRLLLDVPTERTDLDISNTANKKRASGKRKKKAEPTAKERRALAAAAAAEEMAERPNWPDSEFPWRLRTQEREEQAKVEEEERLKWIEKFLDRDTDDEDDIQGKGTSAGTFAGTRDDEEDDVIPSSIWGVVYEDGDDRPVPYRAGRGKMVPLRGDPDQDRKYKRRRSAYFPSDPADARAALLSKKSVRALSFRRQRSNRRPGSDDDEILCYCRGIDDGRELVQCDSCDTWYHLDCLGIDDIAELGPAEDQWFCPRCDVDQDSPPSVAVSPPAQYSEPTFAPTDETPHRRSADAQFYQPSAPESPTQSSWGIPRVPKTPTRGPAGSSEFGSGFTSSSIASSRPDSSRYDPVTPHNSAYSARIVTGSTPGPFDDYDDHFDPTSTPSRGIKFGVPFATPKNSISSRAFQTPSRPAGRGSVSFGAAGFLSSALNERGNGDSPYTRPQAYEDSSPIRREGTRFRRILDPSATSRALFEDSPVVTKGKGRALDFGDVDAASQIR